MTVSRLVQIPGIGVDRVGDAADAADDTGILRLENLDIDIRPPTIAIDTTRDALLDDSANSYLPFQGHRQLREAVTAHVNTASGTHHHWRDSVITAGGLSGVLNVLLATLEPGDEVVMTDPTYAGLINRVHLAGGIPKFVPLAPTTDGWRLDHDRLRDAITASTRVVLFMSPSMPSGAVLTSEDWELVARLTEPSQAWVIDDAAMERILFDDRPVLHPASFGDLATRTITVGSASKELRMIGWRVGWVVGPSRIMADIELVGMANVVCQVGIGQAAVAAALRAPDAADDIRRINLELQARRDMVLGQLAAFHPVRPHGGWSLLIDTTPLGITPSQASARLLSVGKIAATPMSGWGPTADRYLRLVFSNEPLNRLSELGTRFDAALA